MAAALLLAGCVSSGRHNRQAVISVGGGSTETSGVSPGSPDAEAWESIRRSLEVLQREGRIAVNVEAYWPDESPATGVVIEVTDASFRKSTAVVDAVGVARLDLGTLNAARWRAGWNGFWRVVGAPQLAPDRSGQPVIRGVMFLPAANAFAVAAPTSTALDAPAPAFATPSASGFRYPPEVGAGALERVAFLRRESLRAKAAALAARETGDEATFAREMARAGEVGAEYARNYEGRD